MNRDIERLVAAIHRSLLVTGVGIGEIKMSKAAFDILKKEASKVSMETGEKLRMGPVAKLFAIPVMLNEDEGISADIYDGFGNRIKRLWKEPISGEIRVESP